jgi:hypothetical protein
VNAKNDKENQGEREREPKYKPAGERKGMQILKGTTGRTKKNVKEPENGKRNDV